MRRRDFLTLLGGAAAWPVAARGQRSTISVIGVLFVESAEPLGPFRESLRELGYVEGKSIRLELRSAQGRTSLLPQLANELVRAKVDIIVACFTPAVIAAKNATREIPVIMAPAGDPVGMGLISSLARPGGNLTGLSGTGTEMGAKNLEVIREALPSINRVAVLASASDPFTKPFVQQMEEGSSKLQLEIRTHLIRTGADFEPAFANIVQEQSQVVVLGATLPLHPMVDLALKHRLPALSQQAAIARGGALLSYSPSYVERGRAIADYIDRILKGAKPADLPVQQPTRYELVINLKTARALGLDVPPTLLARADEVIE